MPRLLQGRSGSGDMASATVSGVVRWARGARRGTLGAVACAALLVAAALQAPAAAAVRGRLQVAPNGRFLQFQDGTPFFYLGDTAWQLLHRTTREEATVYLEDRARKGFTVIQTVALAELDGVSTPSANGELPLIDRDPARPNPAYFAHVDFVVEKAEALGMFVGLLPTWGRYWKAGEGRIFTPENARAFGRFLGQRYRDRAVIWILGGDQNIATADERAIIEAMAEGLRAGDGGRHLITFHPRGPGRSGLQLAEAPWLDFHMIQSSHGARDHDTGLFVERDRALTPPKPTLDGEPRYEAMPVGFYNREHNRLDRFTDDDVRQAAWWAVLAGACGHTYGNNNIWQMYQPGRAPVLFATSSWRESLDHPGATQMGIMRRFFEARAFQLLVPDQTLVIDGPSEPGAKVRAARASDGSFAVFYTPRGAAFTVDKGIITAPRVRESWFDPRYGVLHEFHTTDNQAFQTYRPPTSGPGQDWVLLLDAVR